ncbi:isochorismatase family protein [Zhihengliuella salsuginis]|uniref:nicotinamidase n=1 Tax=Zhihengliuella salsuginis TaxID=578222 RepID=A0ABQ3GIS6_9MICC|nr:isochorismatase family protein [Zhihengliuella salsuginis]GHD08482.1 nicotinamidase/pyrazinamidase [Zhihengliuella salsuginis]
MADALIIVDVQYDFCEGGALGVDGGTRAAEDISEHVTGYGYDYVVATQDWHIEPGGHFSDTPDFVDSWPVHCVAGEPGSALHSGLDPIRGRLDGIFRKGEYTAGYSGFEGRLAPGNGRDDGGAAGAAGEGAMPHLADWLGERGVTEVRIVGIATDYCVRATALDAVRAGLRTAVVPHLTAAVHPEKLADVLSELRTAGVEIHAG